MFGVFQFKASVVLCIDHEVIGEFVIDIVEVDARKIVFGSFFVQLVQGTFLAGDC